MKILFKISIILSLFSALLFTSVFSASNDSVQFIKTNWVENSEGVIIVNLRKPRIFPVGLRILQVDLLMGDV